MTGVDVDVEPFPRMADKAHHRAPPGYQRERAVRRDGDIRQLSGPVAADASSVETIGGELEIFRNERQQYRTAHARAERGLVVGGAHHGGRARDACADGAPQDIVAEEPLQPVYFVVAPARIECRFLDDVRRLIRRDVHVLQEISAAPGIDDVEYLAIDDAAACESAFGSGRCCLEA